MNKKIFLLLSLIIPGFVFAASTQQQSAEELIDYWIYNKILPLLTGIAGLFAFFMILYGGFLLLTSGGNPDQVRRAKNALIGAFIGLILIFLSWSIANYISKVILGG